MPRFKKSFFTKKIYVIKVTLILSYATETLGIIHQLQKTVLLGLKVNVFIYFTLFRSEGSISNQLMGYSILKRIANLHH